MTAIATAPAASVRADARLTFGGVLRSEWIKFTSLRSTYWTSGVILLLWVGIGLLMASTGGFRPFDPMTGETLPMTEEFRVYTLAMIPTAGTVFGVLVAGIQGVLAMSGEYSTGMIRSSLAAVPGRLPVFAGKAVVVFVWMFLLGAIGTLGTYLATSPFLVADDVDVALDGSVLLAYLGAAVYLGLVGLFGLGIGTLVRNAAGGIAVVVGVLLVLTAVLPLLGLSLEWLNDWSPYLLSNAGTAMSNIEGNAAYGDPALTPGIATVVTAAWSAVSLALGAALLKGRDA
jgi:ABC-2 type transport system permease protein